MKNIQYRNAGPYPGALLYDNELRDKAVGMNAHVIADSVFGFYHGMSADADIIPYNIVLPDENAVPRLQVIPNLATSIDNRVGADNGTISYNQLAYFSFRRRDTKQNILTYDWILAQYDGITEADLHIGVLSRYNLQPASCPSPLVQTLGYRWPE